MVDEYPPLLHDLTDRESWCYRKAKEEATQDFLKMLDESVFLDEQTGRHIIFPEELKARLQNQSQEFSHHKKQGSNDKIPSSPDTQTQDFLTKDIMEKLKEKINGFNTFYGIYSFCEGVLFGLEHPWVKEVEKK
jgi:hypothetical protein